MGLKNYINMNFRMTEYRALFYRIFLAYLFYFMARVLFFLYNIDLIDVESVGQFFRLALIGLQFDTTAILYTNSLFVLLSILPLKINTFPRFQWGMGLLYGVTNAIAYATNFVDFIYYKFSQSRLTTAVFDVVGNEENKVTLLLLFIKNYWHVFLLFFVLGYAWYILYNRVKVSYSAHPFTIKYFLQSILIAVFVLGISIIGIRGGIGNSSRPINMVDAHRYVTNGTHADLVLNSPFCLIRTYNKNFFKKVDFLPNDQIEDVIHPIKQYSGGQHKGKNVVILIMESFGREYIGAFNKHTRIPDYVSYTPFLDSLANHSMLYSNAFSNGRQSIHAMPAILAGVPSFKIAFTSSPYANQKVQSIVSVTNEMGYDTSFFHGAPNGSMGLLGFSNILEFDHYYGKDEFNDNSQFDGVWGIWDEPFFQFMNQTLSQKKSPFLATIFSVTSHEPYQVPSEYKGVFPIGDIPIHQVVGYSDNALRQFFKAAQKEPWFENTLFVLTADHCNESFYSIYNKPINRFAVPVMFYAPKGTLVGESNELTQQMDIFPTLVDLLGYDQPIQSWGRSLVAGKEEEIPFSVHYLGTVYHFSVGEFTFVFDGEKTIGVYAVEDVGLSVNLIENKTPEMEQHERFMKAFFQDYMNRVITKRLAVSSFNN
jgi:phosphoglycerol transferase MdoB-like AlkP superfamily enzyme